jgi:transposase InsO family protein
VRDEVVDWVLLWSSKSGLSQQCLLSGLGVYRSRFHEWQRRQGQANLHNANLPRSCWLLEWEKKAIVDYQAVHPDEGYRRLTYMMLDADVVAVSASTVRRVLLGAGVLPSRFSKRSLKGTGFEQPLEPHEHWHVDVSYINIHGTFFYLFSVLDGASRFIVHWELREAMTTRDIEIILQRAREKFPAARPRIISDNGPQFIANDFKQFIRQCGMSHVRTSPYYPQSNGKLERWHRSMKAECIRPGVPLTLDDGRRLLAAYVHHYNHERLHSALGYVAPADRLHGRHHDIFAARRAKLQAAAEHRKKLSQFHDPGPVQPVPLHLLARPHLSAAITSCTS